MPPRIPVPQGLRSLTLCLRPALTPTPTTSLLPLVQKANLSKKEKKRRMKQDPYRWALAQQRRNANLKRREELEKERKANWGNPVHGITTPFVKSFDTAGQEPVSSGDNQPLPTSPHLRNFLLTKEELDKAIEYSRRVTQPLVGQERQPSDPELDAADLREHEQKHAKAVVALQRITDLRNGSAKDRKHANIRRCIETFGRHVTDHTLERPAPPLGRGQVEQPKPVRAGPDTGSSEVQIAILTAKIRALALALEGPKGHRDKNNKRGLLKLVHRRQRLLRYMERKERGSGRWQHLITTLGLTPATYKGQISL
ncbi:04355c9d-9e48-481e-b419-401b8eda32ac [Thermothielavioides terrestris]|uniref:04355c9d-9e48-481e-b419-401b8eda32ac n=1 Tax=Thermothielavioides terrestris TaxID=2587410 RepID=A0A3S4B378_9PEZI|nr:04355c9d-9e48-481e-b419-401b8eda32ac [Thermothielavioides terrestris]